MRRTRAYIAVATCLAVAAWTAGPALSLERYAPAAVDFSQPLPALERLAARAGGGEPVRFLSPPVRAPRRFDLVGVAGSEDAFEYRVRRQGETWSEWIEVDPGNPLYAGGADWTQVRSRHSQPHGRLHYVNVSGTASARERVLSVARRAINGALLAVARVEPARAQGGISPEGDDGTQVIDIDLMPSHVSRSEWGADRECQPRSSPAYGEVRAALIHHTVTANDYSPAESAGIVLGICRFHRNGNGWNDIGYNALVDRFGRLYEGRAGGLDAAVVGAHARGYNSYTTSIASLGTHTSEQASGAATDSIVDYLSWKLSTHGVPAQGQVQIGSLSVNRISGHRDVNQTGCPGELLYEQIGSIRNRVRSSGNRQVQISLRAQPGVVAFPGSTALTGRLTAPDTGRGLAGVRVEIQRNGSGFWSSFRTRRTDRRGAFRLGVRLTGNRDFRAIAPGAEDYQSGRSGRVPILVRPRLAAGFAPGSRFVRRGVVHLQGRVRPRKRVELQVSRRPRGGDYSPWRSVRRARLDPSGRFVVSYSLRATGRYRFRIFAPASRRTTFAISRALAARVR